jgi:multidrug efflux system outer membrane protein
MLISIGVFLSACSEREVVTRDLTLNLPDRYSVVAPVTQPSTGDLEWWRNFDDPVLNQLIAQGLSGNLNVAEARSRLREAEADARRARGTIVTGDGEAEVLGRRNNTDTGDVRLTAEINLAGRDLRRTEAALARLDAARVGTEEVERLVITEIAATYLNLRFQQQILKTRQLDLASRQQTVADVEKQLNAGAATRLDQLRTRSLAAETQVEIPAIESEIVRQRNRLSTLLGVPVGSLSIDLGYPGRQPVPRRIADIGVPADLLRARPDIRRAERLYAAALSDMDAAQANRYPSLKLSGFLTAPLNGGSSSSSLLAGLVLPVFNQPALAAEVDSAQARVNQAYLQWRIAVLDAVEEVETAQSELRTSLNSKSAARQVVAMNEEALELSRRMLDTRGNITVLDVVDRERALSQSRVALAQSTLDVATGYVDLRSALGQGHSVQDPPKVAAATDG